MRIVFPGESVEYRAARNRLLEEEIELRRAMEAVAAARRELPPGGAIPTDYVFHGSAADGSLTDVRLSELFAPGKHSLVIYSFMFPRDARDQRPGPASRETARLKLDESPCPSCVALLDQLEGAVEHLTPLVNSPMLNVFHRDGDTIRHFWGSELFYAPSDAGQDPRHVGTLEPVWNLLDFTPEGRPSDWDEQLDYSSCGRESGQ